jgi:hypothetical protein
MNDHPGFACHLRFRPPTYLRTKSRKRSRHMKRQYFKKRFDISMLPKIRTFTFEHDPLTGFDLMLGTCGDGFKSVELIPSLGSGLGTSSALSKITYNS